MQVSLDAFRVLVAERVGDVRAVAGKDGFRVEIGQGGLLHADSGRPRVFKNLTTLARFARNENVSSFTVDVRQLPAKAKTSKAKPKAKPKAARASKAAA